MKKAVITVLGHDKVGIIARVCTFLSEANVEYSGHFSDHRGRILRYGHGGRHHWNDTGLR